MDRELFLTKPLSKLFLKLAPPAILVIFTASINSIVDSFFAGRWISPNALAGISMAIPVLSVAGAFFKLISVGASSIVGRAIGEANKNITESILYYVIALTVVFSIIVSLIGIFFSDYLIGLIIDDKEIYSYGVSYLKIMMTFNLPGFMAGILSMLIRSEGKIKYASKISMISIASNLVLTPLLCGYFGLGLIGIASSTICSSLIQLMLALKYFLLEETSYLKPKHIPKLSNLITLKSLVKIGLIGFFIQISTIFRQFVLFKTIAVVTDHKGLVVFSGILRIYVFIAMLSFGITQALQPIVGINFGAKKISRAFNSFYISLGYNTILNIILSIPIFIFPIFILNLFMPEINFTNSDALFFRIYLAILVLMPTIPNLTTFLLSMGNSKKAFLILIGRNLLFIPIVFISWYFKDVYFFYYGLLFEAFMTAFILNVLFFFYRKTYLKSTFS